jgi:hypothetical protein
VGVAPRHLPKRSKQVKPLGHEGPF